MHILLTNDDGYLAEGIRSLATALTDAGHEVVVVAPDRERSGTGRSITLHHPLRLNELVPAPAPGRWLLVNGTPTDCINLGIHYVLAERRPDLVVSGINHGLNLGDDVHYSGTVNAACEANHFAVPALALSQELGDHDFKVTSVRAAALIERLVGADLERPLLLNVNFPQGEPKGYRLTHLGKRVYRDVVVAMTDPRGAAYYWLAGKPHWEEDPGSDQDAILRGEVSISPMRLTSSGEGQIAALGKALGAQDCWIEP